MYNYSSPLQQRIAITGMGLCNALGNDIDSIWQATVEMRSGLKRIQQAPNDPPRFFDAPFVPGVNSYCNVVGLCNIALTRHDLQLPPQDFLTMPASSRLTLFVAQQAVAASGLLQAGYDPQRVGVFLSQNAGEAASTLWDLNLTLRAPGIADMAARVGGWNEAQRKEFLAALQEGRVRPSEGSMLSRINCMVAGTLCQRYGFSGPAYSMGAACSSSMAALFTAVHLLRDGTIDAALIGGGEEMYAPLYMAEFSALGALARPGEGIEAPEEYSRPFDLRRNGFVLGEGAAMLVLEREDMARRRNAPLHGLVTGMGHVTNVRGLIEPDADAQVRAIRASFEGLDYGPEAVDLVETHATSTIQGDLEEGRALAAVYGVDRVGGSAGKSGGRATILSAYKGQIGHTTGASGAMALVHGLLSMRDGIYPGTRNCEQPDPAIPLTDAGLRVLSQPESWDRPESGIRRLQVNSFAFGGACFALQVEEPNERRRDFAVSGVAGTTRTNEDTLNGFEGHEDVVNGVRLVTLQHRGEDWRLGSLVPNWIPEMAGLPVEPTPEELASLSRKGLWLHKADTPPPVAIMCCGQGSVWPGMGRALYDTFPAARAAMDRIAAVAEWDVLGLLDEPELDKIILTRWQQPYLFLLEYAQASYLESLGFKPTVMSGHSLGELIALCLAGVYTPEQGWHILDTRATFMSKLEADATRDMGMMAVHGSAQVVEQALRDFPSLHVSNYNTPTQFILSGPRDVLTEARRALRKNKVPAIVLNVSMAFHHPSMRVLRDVSVERLNLIDMQPPRLPMFSNITTGLYPNDKRSICEYIGDLDENSVRWVECVRNMWKDYGIRHFVELGPADTLCGLTTDIELQAHCIPLGRKGKEVEGVRSAVARLYALGHLPRRQAPVVAAALASPSAVAGAAGREGSAGTGSSAGLGSLMTASGAQGKEREQVADTTPRAAQLEAPPHVEEIMPLVMEATGYERHELGPDMDLRHDLSIRSSRFPLIMSAAEERFNITVRFEDLMGVATIRDLADTMARLRERPMEAEENTVAVAEKAPEVAKPVPVLRHVPQWQPLPTVSLQGCVADEKLLPEAAPLLVVSSGEASVCAQHLRELFGAAHVHVVPTLAAALAALTACKPRGLVLALDAPDGDNLHPEHDLTAQLAQCMRLLQAFLGQRDAALCMALGAGSIEPTPLQQGLSSMLLSAALEYPKVLFRSLWSENTDDRVQALRCLLSGDALLPVQWRTQEGELRTPQLRPCPWPLSTDGLPMRAGDVLVVSGGGKGITPFALRGLMGAGIGTGAGLGCVLALLGRGAPDAEHVRELEKLGATVRAYACDVTDAASVEQALQAVQADWGRVDGVIHAAGLNRDATLAELSFDDMEAVLAVKCRGLRLLLQGAEQRGLRYALAFSSLAAWLGNYGQSNYSAANRAMATELEQWCAARALPWRCIWLPPVTGEGMADSAEVRRQLALRGMNNAWLDVAELGDLLARELLYGAPTQVLWLRGLPSLPTVANALPATAATLRGLAECPQRFPLVFPLSLYYEADGMPVFSGGHHFSLFSDWPFLTASPEQEGWCAAPGVLMACAREAALQLLPWRDIRCVALTHMRFGAPLLCPEGITREAEITARLTGQAHGPSIHKVHTQMQVRNLAPNGRRRDSWSDVCEGVVELHLPSAGTSAPQGLPALWDVLPATHWENAAEKYSFLTPGPAPAHWVRFVPHEEIAHNEESGYHHLWSCIEFLLRDAATRVDGGTLIPVSMRAWKRIFGPLQAAPDGQNGQGGMLLEVRSRTAPHGALCWDAQWMRHDGSICMTMEELLLAHPQGLLAETDPRVN